MSESAHHRCPAPLLPQRSKPRAVHPLRTGQCGRRHWRGPAIDGNQVRLQLQSQRMDVRRPPVVQRQDQIVHLLAGRGAAARPAIGQGLLHHVDVLPHRVGQLRLFLRAPLINARGRCLRCAGHLARRRWQNWRWLRHWRGWRGNGGLCRIASAIASACICAVPRLIGSRPIACCHLGRRLQIPAMSAKADSAAASDAMRRQVIRCWRSRSGLNEVSVITTPATLATGPVQSSYSGQAPLEHAPSRPSCDAEGRGHASPFLHCTDPRRSMPLPSSHPG